VAINHKEAIKVSFAIGSQGMRCRGTALALALLLRTGAPLTPVVCVLTLESLGMARVPLNREALFCTRPPVMCARDGVSAYELEIFFGVCSGPCVPRWDDFAPQPWRSLVMPYVAAPSCEGCVRVCVCVCVCVSSVEVNRGRQRCAQNDDPVGVASSPLEESSCPSGWAPP
jgi:hypothetical protein